MTVCFYYMPSKSFPFLIYWFYSHYFFIFSIYLKTVPVKYSSNIIKFILSRKHSCFPNQTFLNFAVAQQYKNSVIFFIQFCSKGYSV